MNQTIKIFPLVAWACACSADGGAPAPGPTTPEEPSPTATGMPNDPPPMPPMFEDTPQPTMDCKPGIYEGDFSGQVSFLGIPLSASGSVTLTLIGVERPDGEFTELSIENGGVTGEAGGGTYRADVVGKLNCDTLAIEGGGLRNGTYDGFPPLFFEGTITADYVTGVHQFVNGTWSIIDQNNKLPLGDGTWNAELLP